jgi:hypothetical protein
MASYRCTRRRMKIKRARATAPSPDRYPPPPVSSAPAQSAWGPPCGLAVVEWDAVFITDHALIIVRKDTGPWSC